MLKALFLEVYAPPDPPPPGMELAARQGDDEELDSSRHPHASVSGKSDILGTHDEAGCPL